MKELNKEKARSCVCLRSQRGGELGGSGCITNKFSRETLTAAEKPNKDCLIRKTKRFTLTGNFLIYMF